MKLWIPKDPRSRAIIKVTLWSALLTWMVFLLVYAIVGAQRARLVSVELFGTSTWGQILAWVLPVWIVFTTLMLIWAVARFANKRLKKKND
ncbi:hypothetical protein LCGC14_2184270 [marine sediment metagenome]|uniref:Uncharacterized protein n=1 Tax=marine sediment metagenome TaxID=412755 RepID=A0A0F9DLG6_9ZZZZ